MLTTCLIGASGYTGAELIRLITAHPTFDLRACYVSANSKDANKAVAEIHPQLAHISSIRTQAIDDNKIAELSQQYDLIFLATPHEASHDWAPALMQGKAKIYDLSGAFRLSDTQVFADYYGFTHQSTQILQEAVYGLAEWHAKDIAQAKFVAVPGCYPTASLLALKPLAALDYIDSQVRPVINATSGVSGAGRKANLNSSFCEVSLHAYGVLGHRHTPEIEQYSDTKVIFTPHLGQFKRGILATITAKLKAGLSEQAVQDAFEDKYSSCALVRLPQHWPKIDDVAHTPFCDIAWKYDAESGYIVITSAIDNLLKGAASQAIQCANLGAGLDGKTGLIA